MKMPRLPRPLLLATTALLLVLTAPAFVQATPTNPGPGNDVERPIDVEGPVEAAEVHEGAPHSRDRIPIPGPEDGYFIPPGQEKRFIGLIQPHAMGDTVDGWKIGNIVIGGKEVRYQVESGDRNAAVLLQHPEYGDSTDSRSLNFSLRKQCDGECPAVIDLLVDAIQANDQGAFWTHSGPGLSELLKPRHAHRMLEDGIVLFLLALLLLGTVLWRQHDNGPAWVPLAVLGIVLLGALLRWWLAVEAPMTAWPYERTPALAAAIWRGQILSWFTRGSGTAIAFTDLIFRTNFLLAVLTPLAVFAHARYLLGNYRLALAAALLFAILPSHIRASRSDVAMIQSLAMASLTFIIIYTALLDRSLWIRLAFLALIPVVSMATYRIRPENFGLAFIDLFAVYVVADKGVPRRRQILVGSVIAITAAHVFFNEFIVSHSDQVATGMSLANVASTISTFLHPRLNTFINPFVTPPWILLLAILGIRWLWKDGQPRRAVFMMLWFFGYLFIHSIITAHATTMQARYHLQLVTPFIMLAAAATPVVLEWSRRRKAVLASLLLVSPVLYSGFIRDTNYYEMEEFAFLRKASTRIPDGCTVLEFSPAYSLMEPDHLLSSRLSRFALQLKNGREAERFQVLNPGVLREGTDFEVPTRQVRDLVESPPECLVVYEGLTCFSHRPDSSPIAPVCDALAQWFPEAELLGSTTFTAKLYDGPFIGRQGWPDPSLKSPDNFLIGVHPGSSVTLRLYRAGSPSVAAIEEL